MWRRPRIRAGSSLVANLVVKARDASPGGCSRPRERQPDTARAVTVPYPGPGSKASDLAAEWLLISRHERDGGGERLGEVVYGVALISRLPFKTPELWCRVAAHLQYGYMTVPRR
jgi:hypothetical protein